MLGKIFPAVLSSLVPIERRAGLCVLHYGSHQIGHAGKLGLGLLNVPGQRVKLLCGSVGLCGQIVIFKELVLFQILQRSRHLFKVIRLGPAFIGRAFALTHPLLNVDQQIDTAGCGRFPRRGRSCGSLAVNDGLHVLGAVAVPQRGRPETGRPLLSWHKERDHAAAPVLDLYACRFHAPEKVCKVLGALRQGRVNGKADLFFL